ncbi:hypothetical protein JG687_00003719 [Phytophthora cactorum]|uniref:Uncharacterized protein n=1 Tax=Phytophthora cactorum TaxID=29920 RepID=A0A8T1UQQ9_9STRA|nr:hypothetical protein PC120_g2496 [Phytophthora cactorum]KAG3084796.1 hypothetical protein PC121_g5305 [Phytophthora cactorum]KAG4057507.1 hypothetical protein PC123_g7475 [Phytophthora cactorum]KAG6968484.1 hypothetical protein JG687_00003719 [Phytophthora cactorum]
MYIGPWQEYRLAKIQDDAIQRLRQEWEAQLRDQLPPGGDDRIRELMQPLVAKLPSLLLAAKTRTSGSSAGSRNGRLTRSRSSVSSEASTRVSSRPESALSNVSSASTRSRTSYSSVRGAGVRRTKPRENNQESHSESSSRAPFKPPKSKKGKKALTALEQVQKRKKMFATWIKQAGSNDNSETSGQAAPEAKPETKEVKKVSVRLPPIHSAVPASAASLLGDCASSKLSSPIKMPPLNKLSVSTDATPEMELPNRAAAVSPLVFAPSNAADIDLDESVDEEEVNKLLNWTDTLLSPQALDSLCDFDD